MHVACADLEQIRVFEKERDLHLIHDFADDEKAVTVSGRTHDLEALLAHALKAVRGAARFESAAANDLRTLRGDDGGGRFNLFLALDAARASHGDNSGPAEFDRAEFDDGAGRLEMPAGEFISRDDAMAFLDAFEDFENCRIEVILRAYAAEYSVADAGGTMDSKPHLDQAVDDVFGLGNRGPFLHDD